MKTAKAWSCLLLMATLALPASTGWSGTHPRGAVQKLQQALHTTLKREGYIGTFAAGNDLQRGISAYLWDNRQWLLHIDFNNARQVDTLVCLLVKKGYPGFDEYVARGNLGRWCETMVQKP